MIHVDFYQFLNRNNIKARLILYKLYNILNFNFSSFDKVSTGYLVHWSLDRLLMEKITKNFISLEQVVHEALTLFINKPE